MARVIAAEPQLVLADEPTANLEDESARRISSLLRQQVAVGRSVIVATRDRRLYGPEDLVFDLEDGAIRAA